MDQLYHIYYKKQRAAQLWAARRERLESVDVDIEFVGQVREVYIEGIGVVVEFYSKVVRYVDGQVLFVFKFFKVRVGRNVESHVIVVAGSDCVYEFDVWEVGRQMFRDISK